MAESKTYRLLLTEGARDDIMDLTEFYEELVPGMGNTFIDHLGDLLVELQDKPFQWQYAKSAKEGIRRAILRKPAVIVLYEVEERTVYVASVKDARSNWQEN